MAKMQLLKDVTVVDLGHGLAPALVATFLKDAGARTIRIEQPGDAAFSDYYPCHQVRRREQAAAPLAALDELLEKADICILGGEDWPGVDRTLQADAIAERFPRLVVLEIESYPSGTAHAGRPATDLLAQARSGLCYEHYSDRPVVMSFNPADHGAALQALIGVLAALYERESSGKGQVVRTSLLEGALSWISLLWGRFENATPLNRFVMPKDPWPLIFQARDGKYIQIVMGSAGSKYRMYKALDIDDPTVQPGDSGMVQPGGDPRNFYGDVDLLAAHVARQDAAPLLERIWKDGLPAEPVLPPGACWDEPQVAHNGVIATCPDGTRRVGFPFQVRESQARGGPCPRSGVRPLDGVKAVDFGAFVAGPLASAVLAELGAQVVKVEPPAGDPSRAMVRSFNAANRGKTGITLDLKDPAQLDIARDLCAAADLVSSNFRTGVSDRLGIGPSSLHAMRPDMIVLEAPAYGSGGPLADRAGFDMVMQALCGHEFKGGGKDNPPMWNRTSMVDLAGGLLGAIGALLGLYHRARTGNGTFIDSPLLNAGIFLTSNLVQTPDGRFEGAPILNRDRTGYHPAEALYQTADGWIAVAARGAAATAGLADALALRLPADPASWGERQGDEIADALRSLPTQDACRRLRARDVWVEECRQDMEADILEDPDLQRLGIVRRSIHPEFGEVLEPGLLVRFSRSGSGNGAHTPLLGEGNEQVLARLRAHGAADQTSASTLARMSRTSSA